MKILKTKKGKIIFACVLAGLLIVAGVILAVVLHKEEYRSISVEAVSGSVTVVNDNNNDQAYKGQRLYGGDDVTVSENSDLTMCMNNDKYLYAAENTHFRLEDRSTKNASRIRIILDKGSELNELTEKLNTNESYEVDTPNSTMSVRGTKFRVTVFTDSDGLVYTLLEVEEGVVLVQLKTVTGEYNGVEKEFTKGQSALIRADIDFSEFVKSEKGEEVLELDYSALPKEPVERLLALLKMLMPGEEDKKPQEEEKKPQDEDKKPQDDKGESGKEHEHTKGPLEVTTEAGCETKGEKTAKCTECGEIMQTEEIDPLGHEFSDWTIEKEASCKEEGSESRKCSRCGKTESRVVSATGNHKWGKLKEDVAPGCLTKGSGHYECTICGAEGEHETIAAKGHNYSAWTTQKKATCEESGTEIRKCSSCGNTETRSITRLSHNWSGYKTVKQATCAAAGSQERTCSLCGKKETKSVPATGNHSFGSLITDVPAGCTTDGSGHYECSVCGAEGEQETIPKTGHDYKEKSKEKIDDEHYKVTYRCENCGSEYSATKAGKI